MSSGPHHSVPMSSHQNVARDQTAGEAKRKSKDPTDKTMPDGVEDAMVDDDGLRRYNQLRDLEKRLDATMVRKRLDMMDSASRSTKVIVRRNQSLALSLRG
jgi:hypothetical protein